MNRLVGILLVLVLISAALPSPVRAQIPWCIDENRVEACGSASGIQGSRGHVSFMSSAFNSPQEARAQVEDWLKFQRAAYGEIEDVPHQFGEYQLIVEGGEGSGYPEYSLRIGFVRGNTANLWGTWGRERPIEFLHELYLSLDADAGLEGDRSERSAAMLPTNETMNAHDFEDLECQYSPRHALHGSTVSPGDSDAPVRSTSTSVTNSRASRSDKTVEIYENPEMYHNRLIHIQGRVYVVDVVNGDTTVLILTDEETYLFTVVYEGLLPEIREGDTVVVDGILLDRTVEGTPLVDATKVKLAD